MRKLLLVSAVMAMAVSSFAARLVIGPIGGGEPTQQTLVRGEVYDVTSPVVSDANSVQITITSDGELVFDSGKLNVVGGAIAFQWYALQSGQYKATATSYDADGNTLNVDSVATFSVVQPEAVGFLTGGGWFPSGRRDNFGFVGQVLGNGNLRGSLEFQKRDDPQFGDVNVRSTQITHVARSADGRVGYMWGYCNLNGASGFSFCLVAVDNGEPGTRDQLSLWVYNAQGRLTWTLSSQLSGGNIQVR